MSNQPGTQEITLVPVDENGRALLFCDIKIEQIDRDYRTVREPEGLKWRLQPGTYTVKVFLRNLEMKTVPLTIRAGVSDYRLQVPTSPSPVTFEYGGQTSALSPRPAETSKKSDRGSDPDLRKRFPISFPVSYKTDTGQWTKSKALNVSASGLCVENLSNVTENDNLYVKLHVPVATIPIECPARVVWVISNATKKCMGLQLFLTSNMRESLDRWLSGI